MIARRKLLLLGICGLGGAGLATFGKGTIAIAGTAPIYSNSSTGIAINGYDPVAYFTQHKPVEGSSAYSTKWKGAVWHFSSAKNKSAFIAAPEKFAPQYGGYCAFAAAYNAIATTVPEAWSIVNGKLYLNNSIGVRRDWQSDVAGFIKKADANWPGLVK